MEDVIGRDIAEVTICSWLREASDGAAFFEALVHFGQHPIPFGARHEECRRDKDASMRAGRELSILERISPGSARADGPAIGGSASHPGASSR